MSTEWIDKNLSLRISVLRNLGEGQDLEFKQKYPENSQDLGKEIAAFASTNAGTILIGIGDDGSLIGIEGVNGAEARDALRKRIEGICRGTIKPAITPLVKFAEEAGKIILVIEVLRGSEPIYYCNHIPYVRHLSSSRPADPHEVIERITERIKEKGFAPANDEVISEFYSSLLSILIDVIITSSEFQQREVNPWLQQSLSLLELSASQLRALAAEDAALQDNLALEMKSLAGVMEKAYRHRLTLGGDSWETLLGYVAEAQRQAITLKTKLENKIPLSKASVEDAWKELEKSFRELKDLTERADELAEDGQLDELQNKASRIGYVLVRLGNFPVPDFPLELQKIGTLLHLIETETIYMDGGESVRKIIEKLKNGTTQLARCIRGGDRPDEVPVG